MKPHLKPKKGDHTQRQRDSSVDKKEMRANAEVDKVLFSFRYFDKSQIPPGQTFEDWAQQNAAYDCICELQKLLENSENIIGDCDEQALQLLQIEEKISEFQQNFDKETAKKNRLAALCDLLVDLSDKTRQEAEKGIITTYGSFPPDDKTEFKLPKTLQETNLQWATIQKIDGQKTRVAGFWEANIFYIVFLDADHVFWKSEKKHT